MRSAILGIILAILVTAPSHADEGRMGAAGGTLKLMEGHPSIRMTSEYVHLKVREKRLDVYCKFVFHNEGKATTVRMGFPEDITDIDDGFRYFRSRVDGKAVPVKRVKGALPEPRDPAWKRNWMAKTVHFAAGQTRVVEDRYGGSVGGKEDYEASYVLTTGRSWHGTIGRAVVTADISAIRSFQTIRPSPAGYRRCGNTITWTFRDFEPKSNIRLEFNPNYTWFFVDGREITSGYLSGVGPIITGGVLRAWCRDLSDLLCGMDSEDTDSSCTLKYNGKTMQLKAGSKTAYLNGRKLLLPIAPYVTSDSDGRYVMVPLRAVGEAFGFKITQAHGKTYISSPKPHV